MLKALAAREVAIPDHINMYLLDREIAATDMTALQAVMEVDQEKARLEKEGEMLADMEMTPEVESRLSDVYERYITLLYIALLYITLLYITLLCLFGVCTRGWDKRLCLLWSVWCVHKGLRQVAVSAMECLVCAHRCL
jgi:hypothetical protein